MINLNSSLANFSSTNSIPKAKTSQKNPSFQANFISNPDIVRLGEKIEVRDTLSNLQGFFKRSSCSQEEASDCLKVIRDFVVKVKKTVEGLPKSETKDFNYSMHLDVSPVEDHAQMHIFEFKDSFNEARRIDVPLLELNGKVLKGLKANVSADSRINSWYEGGESVISHIKNLPQRIAAEKAGKVQEEALALV